MHLAENHFFNNPSAYLRTFSFFHCITKFHLPSQRTILFVQRVTNKSGKHVGKREIIFRKMMNRITRTSIVFQRTKNYKVRYPASAKNLQNFHTSFLANSLKCADPK